ncbi:MAG TPA: alpha/beta fold hydrolase [Thermoanaerobaculia bacterium]|nr:alpha/beta fold hydrolase [Thermoanaerobaculia bacterium]
MSPVELHVRDLGGGGRPPLVVLHGLYGSSRNWVTAGRALSEHFHVLALDLRNHGQSPHHSGMGYDDLVADVLATLDTQSVERAGVMGHSLGGKVAMALACRAAPERVRELYVLDIAPREYTADTGLLDALLAVDLSRVSRRAEAEEQLADAIPDRALRLFLLTNLVRGPDAPDRPDGAGQDYVWQADLEALRSGMSEIRANPLEPGDRFEGPTRFIVGGGSRYVSAGDREVILRHFPKAEIIELEDVGHDVHIEGGDGFLSAVLSARS